MGDNFPRLLSRHFSGVVQSSISVDACQPELHAAPSIGRFRRQKSILGPSDDVYTLPDALASPGATLANLLDGYPRHAAVSITNGGPVCTREELKQLASIVSTQLIQAGCNHGDVILLVADNSLCFVVSLLAIIGIGAIAAPLSTELTVDEYMYSFDNLQPRLMVLSENSSQGEASIAAAKVGLDVAVAHEDEVGKITLHTSRKRGGVLSFVKNISKKAPRPTDYALALQHTDGTSASSPYAFALTHANIIAGIAAVVQSYQLTSEDKTLVSMPMYHVQGLFNCLFGALASGGEAVLPAAGKFSAGSFWSDVAERGVSYVSLVPTAVALVARHRNEWESSGRPALRFIAASCGSGLLSKQVREQTESAFGAPIIESLGIPDASNMVACNTFSSVKTQSGTVGLPCKSIEIEIRDAEGNVVEAGVMGSVYIRGSAVSTAHIRQGEIISPIPGMKDGWFDIHRKGSFDAKGNLVVSSDYTLINQGGNKLEPSEVEASLAGLPGAVRVAAFPVEHSLMGQVVGVAIEVDEPSIVISNGDVCAYATASEHHPLAARWLPACTVLVQSGSDWPEVPFSEFSQAFGLSVLSGRSNETFSYSVGGGLVKTNLGAEKSNVVNGMGSLERSVSYSAREKQALKFLEEAVEESFASVLDLDPTSLTPDTNFFETGGASLQIMALLRKIKELTGISLAQSDAFIRPTVKELALYLLMKKQSAAERNLSGNAKELEPPPVIHVPADSPLRTGWQPASYGQEQMCLANEQSGAGAAYNMPYCVKLSGHLDVPALRAAILSTVRAEDGLRSLGRLNYQTLKAEQFVVPEDQSEKCLEFLTDSASNEEEALRIVEREQAHLFDLEHGPVVRVNLVKINPKLHYLLVNFHHLNIDGWTQVLHRRLVLQAYVACALASAAKQPPPPPKTHSITYSDFAAWQRQWLEVQGGAEHQLAYWKKELHDAPMIDLPFDRQRTANVSDSGGKVDIHIPASVVNEWRKLLSGQGATLFMGALAVYHILLHRWSGQADIVVGAATANRVAHPDLPDMVGQFANELALRCDLSGRPTYFEVLQRLKTKVLDAWASQDVPWHEVVAALDVPRVTGTTPIFQVFFALQESSWHVIDVDTSPAQGLKADIVRISTHRSKFSVHLMLRERVDGGLDGDLLYPTALWDHATMQRMGGHFETLAASIVAHPDDVPIGALQMLTPQEQHTVQVEWNKTAPSTPFPAPQRMELQIRNAALRNPDSIALEAMDGSTVTYGELIKQSSAIAAQLGVGPDDVGALAFRGEIEMVVAVLGVLMTGATYLPIDVEHTPVARMQLMLEDAKPQVFFMMDRYNYLKDLLPTVVDSIRFISYQSLNLETSEISLSEPPPSAKLSADALAGLFYTSGSTGPPKGVMIAHSSIHNLIHWWSRLVDLGPKDKSLLFSSYSFIMSLRQMVPTLAMGATLVIPGTSVDFANAISQCGVTKIALTPSGLATVDIDATPSLKRVQVAGEAPTLALAKQWAARLEAFYIGLGPTELCAHACTGLFPPGENTVSIGWPVTNAAVYITNDEGQCQPANIVGELWVAGENVAKGYLNRPDLNEHSFIENPYDPEKPRLYRTGDYAKRLPDGRVVFQGRRDAQVKIRGFRVEMREIVEAILTSAPKLQRAEVMLLDSQLVAFVTPKLLAEEQSALRRELQRQLQDYMIPGRIIDLEAFPLNKNGKLDRQALIKIGQEEPNVSHAGHAASEAVSISTPMQKLVQKTWAEILQKSPEELNLQSNFFNVGGTSLSGILAMRRLGAALECQVPSTVAFSAQELGEQATELEKLAGIEAGGNIKGFDFEARGTSSITIDDKDGSEESEVQDRPLPQLVYGLLQTLGVLVVVAAGMGPAGGSIAMCLWLILEAIGFAALPLLPFVWMAGSMVHLLAAFLIKHILFGGRLRPGVYSIYGVTFLRWWLLRKLINVTRVWLWYVNNTPLNTAAYRFLGAHLESGVTLDDAVLEDLDLITIEKNAVLQPLSSLIPGEIIGDVLILKPVVVGSNSKLEPRAAVLGGGKVGSNSIVRPWSAVTSRSATKEYVIMHGSPAEVASKLSSDSAPSQLRALYTNSAVFIIGQVIGTYFLILAHTLGFGTSVAIARAIATHSGGFETGVYCFLAFPIPIFIVLVILTLSLKWIIIGRIKPGRYDGAWFGLRMWFMDRLLMSPILRMAVYALFQEGTTYVLYLKALGVKVGEHVWWNRPWVRTGMDLLTVGDHVHAGQMEIFLFAQEDDKGIEFKPIEIGDNCTLGQRVVAMPGVKLGKGVTVGAEGALFTGIDISDGNTVFGSPPTIFTSSATDQDHVRQLQAQAAAEEGRYGNVETATSDVIEGPTVARTPQLMLAVSTVTNVAVMPAIGAVYGLFYYLIVWIPLRHTIAETPGWLALLIPAVYIAGTIFLAILLVLVTRIGIGNFRTGSTPFYSWRFFAWCFIAWFNDLVSGIFLYPVAGTWVYNVWLKLMGARIGKNSFIAPYNGGFREVNHMDIGDRAMLLSSNVQGHFIDHNALQFAPCKVERNARLNIGATAMPLSNVGEGSTMRAVATTIKGQQLSPGLVFLGSPAAVDS